MWKQDNFLRQDSKGARLANSLTLQLTINFKILLRVDDCPKILVRLNTLLINVDP